MRAFLQRLAFAFLLLLGAGAALAQPAAPAAGEGKSIVLNHFTAVALDNAEGLLEPHVRMRLLLSDREIPTEALYGIAFPPVRGMARHGDVRGLLVEFDPKDQTHAQVTNLQRPADPGDLLASLSLSDSEGLFRNLKTDAKHISGRFVSADNGIDLPFDAAVTTDPVLSNVTGGAVKASPFIAMLRARAQALGKGDMAALRAMSSRFADVQDSKDAPPTGNPQFKAFLASYTKSLDKASRIVVRDKTAVVLLPDQSFAQFVKEGGDWKLAD